MKKEIAHIKNNLQYLPTFLEGQDLALVEINQALVEGVLLQQLAHHLNIENHSTKFMEIIGIAHFTCIPIHHILGEGLCHRGNSRIAQQCGEVRHSLWWRTLSNFLLSWLQGLLKLNIRGIQLKSLLVALYRFLKVIQIKIGEPGETIMNRCKRRWMKSSRLPHTAVGFSVVRIKLNSFPAVFKSLTNKRRIQLKSDAKKLEFTFSFCWMCVYAAARLQ